MPHEKRAKKTPTELDEKLDEARRLLEGYCDSAVIIAKKDDIVNDRYIGYHKHAMTMTINYAVWLKENLTLKD